MRSPLSIRSSSEPRPVLDVCLGTRPEIIKMAPVIQALRRRGLAPRIIHTGQHKELAWPLYQYFDLEPEVELERGAEGQGLAGLSAGLLKGLDRVLEQSPPQAMLVHGDTTTAAMAALASFYRNIPVAHVEAGLRSHRRDDPFPEELNRSLIARLARWHFAPSETAVRNLYREGIDPESTFLVGNTIVDATQAALERRRASLAAAAHGLGLNPHRSVPAAEPGAGRPSADASTQTPSPPQPRLVLVTLHRRENWGETVAGISRAIFALVQAHPELEVVWPLHANPVLAESIREQAKSYPPERLSRCHLVAPLDYPELIDLLAHAWLVITDSGGLQEEACALKVPALVTRTHTERPELIDLGAGRLVGTDPLNLIREFEGLWRDPARHAAMCQGVNPYGDGRAAERIATVLAESLAGPHAFEHASVAGRPPPPRQPSAHRRAALLARPAHRPAPHEVLGSAWTGLRPSGELPHGAEQSVLAAYPVEHRDDPR